MVNRFFSPELAKFALENNSYNGYLAMTPVDEVMDDGLGHKMLRGRMARCVRYAW